MNNNVIEAANKLKNYPADFINKDDIQNLRTIGYKDFNWGDRPVGDNTISELNNDLNNIPEVTENISNEDRSKQSLAALYKAADPLHRDVNTDEIKEPEEPKPKSDRYINAQFRKNFGLTGNKIKKEDVEEAIENKPNEVIQSDMPESAKAEARQIIDDNDSRNDEANDKNVKAATKELQTRNVIPGSEPDPLGLKFTNEDRANWNNGKDRAIGDRTLSEIDAAKAERTRPVKPGTEMLSEAKPKGILGAGLLNLRDGKIPKPSEERPIDASTLEQITEENPEVIQDKLSDTPIAEEAEQITEDGDKRNDEVSNEAAEETAERLSDDFETVDDLVDYLKTPESGIDWDALERKAEEEHAAIERGEEIPGFPKVSDKRDWENNSTYSSDIDDIVDDVIDSYTDIVDYGLEDQNQYGPNDINLDETVASDKPIPEVNEDDFEPAPEMPYADNVLQLKQDNTEEVVEEAVDDVVEDEKPNRFLGLPKLSGKSKNINMPSATKSSGNIASPGTFTAGGTFGNNLSSVSSPNGAISSSSVASVPKQNTKENDTKSVASKAPSPILKEDSKAVTQSPKISHTGTPSTGLKSSIGTYQSGGVQRNRSKIAVSNSGIQYAPKTEKAGKAKITLAGVKETGDMNLDGLIQKIISLSKTWDNPKDSDGLYTPYHIIIQGNNIYINRMLLQTIARKNPNIIRDLTNKLGV